MVMDAPVYFDLVCVPCKCTLAAPAPMDHHWSARNQAPYSYIFGVDWQGALKGEEECLTGRVCSVWVEIKLKLT